jgi:3-oxoacyl-[acyl-carrier-protein] synthase II
MSDRRVVVTGLGAVTPLGLDVTSTWQAMLAGHSGVREIGSFDASPLAVRIAAEIPDFDPDDWMGRREARHLDRYAQLFWASTKQALDDAGLAFAEDDPQSQRAGVAVGSGIGGVMTFQESMDAMRQRGHDRVSPYAIPRIISNMAAGVVSMDFNLFGPSVCSVTACAASANALGDAAEIIRRGDADIMAAGGAEAAVCEFAITGFMQSRALSRRNDDPPAASRPFDKDRDGFVVGEGAATLVLEERAHALARGADIYGELIGYGMSSDGFHMTLPRPDGAGAAWAMKNALKSAGLAAEDIDYVNAHGTSTQANDSTETTAIRAAYGDHADRVPVSSTKSMTGHLLGGAGALESIVCILAIRDGVVPPTINYETPDPKCDLDYVPNEARQVVVRRAMSNSFGFGGHNVALVFAAA